MGASPPQRWETVLAELYERVGMPGYQTIADHAKRSGDGGPLSKSTVGELLNGKANARRGTVEAFVAGCLHYARTRPAPVDLSADQRLPRYWLGRYDQAREGRRDRVGRVRVGVPPLLADCFQDRAVEVVFAERPATVVLSGMGGVGKTQIAARLAARAWETGVDVVAWVPARSTAEIVNTYGEILRAVTSEPRRADHGSPLRDATQLLQWLATTERRWLIVLDGLNDPADLRGLWPPSTTSGQTVVTTRRREAALRRADHHFCEVDVFSHAEALSYVRGKLADYQPLQAGSDQLVTSLEYLPLAISQAVAFLLDQQLTCGEYLGLLANRRQTLRDLAPDVLPDDHVHPVAMTWSLSINLADRLTPKGLARPLLELASLLDSAGIPYALFSTEAILNYLAGLADGEIDVHEVHRALHCLHNLNLATVDRYQPDRGVQLHGLVQRAVHESPATAASLTDAAWAAADALHSMWPKIEMPGDGSAALRSNAEILYAVVGNTLLEPMVHPVLLRLGASIGETGLITDAIGYFMQLHHASHEQLGADHPDTLITRIELAKWRGRFGDGATAVEELNRILADQLRVRGPDHPDTLTLRCNIASSYGQAGDTERAIALLKQALLDKERILDRDDPGTLSTRNMLAGYLGKNGENAEAIRQYEHLLGDQLRILGPNHIDTLITRNNLAERRMAAGDRERGLLELEQLLRDRTRLLGPNHPHTLISSNNLAVWKVKIGDPTHAITRLQQVLSSQLKVLSPHNTAVFRTRHNLAVATARAGDPVSATVALTQLLADQESALSPESSEIRATRESLAFRLQEAGLYRQACDMFHHVLADRVQVHGEDPQAVAVARNNLANCQGLAGNIEAAIAELSQLLVDRLQEIGPDHLEILAIRQNLLSWKLRTVDVKHIIADLEALRADQIRLLGPAAPMTLSMRRDIAEWKEIVPDNLSKDTGP
jgi:tetratricopeptide (TPR) repeat protein